MIVDLTADAERDLESIGDFIAQDDPHRAVAFVGELREKCLGLADFPHRFPLVPRFAHYGIRHRTHGGYLIFYQPTDDRVVVVSILHGARDYDAILGR